MNDNYKKQAEDISNEFMPGANTASRIGEVLVAIVDEVDRISIVTHDAIGNMTDLVNKSLDEIHGGTTSEETTTEKLKSIYDSKIAIRQAIQNKGAYMLDNPQLSAYAGRIASIKKDDSTWLPNETWWNIKSIVQYSTNQEFTFKTIQLLLASDTTSTFTGGVAYKTSDGRYYTTPSVTHTWDTTKDKQCIVAGEDNYQTRWVITYHSTPKVAMNYFQYNCLYYIMDGVVPTTTKVANSDVTLMPALISFDMINGADFTNITDFSDMFALYINLKSIPQIDTSNGTDFGSMFTACCSLESIPHINTSNGTTFSSMFDSCFSLKNIPQLDTSNGTAFRGMFNSCFKLTSIPPMNTSKGTNFENMFNMCTSLKSISSLNLSQNENSVNYLLTSCLFLESARIANVSRDLDLSNCEFLDHDSLLYLLNNLVSNPYSQLKLGKTNLAKLTTSEKAIATNKGWILA